MTGILVWLVWFCLAVVVYHVALYPLLACFLARRSPLVPVDRSPTVSVSILVAAYNEADVIEQKLASTLALDYPDFEVIVVSDGSTDGTPDLARRFDDPRLRVVEIDDRRGKGNALNVAAGLATGEILVVSDANAFLEPDSLRKLVAGFAAPSLGCTSGRVVPAPDRGGALGVGTSESVYWRYENFIKSCEAAAASATGVVGSLLAVRRSLFTPIPAEVVNDDAYLMLSVMRGGHRVGYQPDAVCFRRPSRNTSDDMTRRKRIAAGRYQLLLRLSNWPLNAPLTAFFLFSHKFLRLLVPVFLAVAFVSCLILAVTGAMSGLLWLVFLPQALVVGLAVLGGLLERLHIQWRLAGLALYVVKGMLGQLHGLLRHAGRGQSVLWDKVDR